MLKLTTPKKLTPETNLFYVSSEANPNSKEDTHIVVRDKFARGVYYCDCRDFFVRRLPNLGTSLFSLCKHGAFVRDTVNAAPAGAQVISGVRIGRG